MIGDKLKELRKAKRLTQKEIAELCGLSEGYIQQIESGKKPNPSIDVLTKLAAALTLPVNALIQSNSFLDGLPGLINSAADFNDPNIVSTLEAEDIDTEELKKWFKAEAGDASELDEESIKKFIKFLHLQDRAKLLNHYQAAKNNNAYIPKFIEDDLEFLRKFESPAIMEIASFFDYFGYEIMVSELTDLVRPIISSKDGSEKHVLNSTEDLVSFYAMIKKDIQHYGAYAIKKALEDME